MPQSRTLSSSPVLSRALLAPRSIAIVGASADPSKVAARPLQFLRQAGYAGTIYPINARRDTVLGERAWPSLAALPEAPDHAFILAGAEGVLDAVRDCAARGVKIATILATGFAEAGHEGLQRVDALKKIVAETGIRILGPSSIGVVNFHAKALLTANAAFAEPNLPTGGVFVASHSGSMLGALVSRGKARSVGFAGLVSVGNEIDLTLGEICAMTLDDPAVTGYMLFLESLRHADDLRRFAVAAAERGKPVVAYKLGRSQQGAELALSHTGALAGEDDIAGAFLSDCGIARVENFEALLETLPLLGRVPAGTVRGRAPRVGVVTTTGGGAAMVVDGLALRGVDVTRPSDDTFARLQSAGVSVERGVLVDLTMAGTRPDIMKAALDVMLSAPEFDLVVAVTGSSARFRPELAVKPVIESASTNKPLVSFLAPDAPDALAMLSQANVPNFRTPEACADAIAAAFARRAAVAPINVSRSVRRNKSAQLNEHDAYALFARVGVPHASSVVLQVDASAIDLPFAYPVVVKLLSDTIAHKSDVGGVVLNVRDAAGVKVAMRSIAASVRKATPDADASQVIVQPMLSGLGELLLGYRKDADAGPVVLLAAGGIYTEIYRDRSIRLAPVTLKTAGEMISELAIVKTLQGFRGRPNGDIEGVAHAIVALSQLALDEEYDVVDAEINPLLVRREGEGVVALDALVRLA